MAGYGKQVEGEFDLAGKSDEGNAGAAKLGGAGECKKDERAGSVGLRVRAGVLIMEEKDKKVAIAIEKFNRGGQLTVDVGNLLEDLVNAGLTSVEAIAKSAEVMTDW